jgi:hypothetical protein
LSSAGAVGSASSRRGEDQSRPLRPCHSNLRWVVDPDQKICRFEPVKYLESATYAFVVWLKSWKQRTYLQNTLSKGFRGYCVG